MGIGTSTPAEKLDVNGNIRSSSLTGVGFRLVYSDANGVLTNNFGTVSPAWLTTGNAGTVAGTHFIGTTDAQALDIRTKTVY